MRTHGWSPPSSPSQRFRSQWRVGCARGGKRGRFSSLRSSNFLQRSAGGANVFVSWTRGTCPPCPPLPTFAHHCPPLPTIAHLCPPLPTFAHLCPPLPTFAHLCLPLPTFAHLSHGFKWARKGRGLTRRPLATTRRNASAKHSGGIRAFVRFAGRFLANESQPARRATPMPSARNARTRRSHVVAAARTSQRCIRTALPRRVGRIPAGFRRPSNGNTKGHESSIR